MANPGQTWLSSIPACSGEPTLGVRPEPRPFRRLRAPLWPHPAPSARHRTRRKKRLLAPPSRCYVVHATDGGVGMAEDRWAARIVWVCALLSLALAVFAWWPA